MIKTRILPALVAAALVAPGTALAAGGGGHTEDVAFSFEGPFGTFDAHQLQRGFQVYHKVCAACHGLKFVAFRELGRDDGPAFPEAQVKAIAATYTCIDPEADGGERACKASDLFPANTGAGAPDLSLMAKARAGFHGPAGLGLNQLFSGMGGSEYIYSVLTGYNGKDEEVAGSALYGNDATGGALSMAPPLYDGVVDDYEINYGPYDATGAVISSEGAESGDGHAYHAPEPTIEQMAEDVSAFLMFTAEPNLVERKSTGFKYVLFLLFVTVLLYYTNKALWAPIKRKA